MIKEFPFRGLEVKKRGNLANTTPRGKAGGTAVEASGAAPPAGVPGTDPARHVATPGYPRMRDDPVSVVGNAYTASAVTIALVFERIMSI
jgi:hypothetical protein